MKIFIETDRLILREIVEADEQALFELESDPVVHKYIGNSPLKNGSEAASVIQHIRKQYVENGIGRWAVILKENSELIGWSGLKYEKVIREEFDYYDLGYRFKQKYWGKGIATETALVSLEYGFNTMNLNSICAAAHVQNIGSNKVIEKAGLKLIETFNFENALHNWYELEKLDWLKLNQVI